MPLAAPGRDPARAHRVGVERSISPPGSAWRKPPPPPRCAHQRRAPRRPPPQPDLPAASASTQPDAPARAPAIQPDGSMLPGAQPEQLNGQRVAPMSPPSNLNPQSINQQLQQMYQQRVQIVQQDRQAAPQG